MNAYDFDFEETFLTDEDDIIISSISGRFGRQMSDEVYDRTSYAYQAWMHSQERKEFIIMLTLANH